MKFEDDLQALMHQLESENQKIIQEIRGFIEQGNIAHMPIEKLNQLHQAVQDLIGHSATLEGLKEEILD